MSTYSDFSSASAPTTKMRRARRFGSSLVAAAFIATAVFTAAGAGVSEAWTNNTKNYNLIENNSWGNSIATDGQGNSYAVVSIKNSFTIGSVTATTAGAWRYLILKTNRSGTAVWGTIGLDGNGDVMGIKADSSGNVYAVGQFNGTATIGGTTITSAGSNDIFIEKLNSSGSLAWVRTFGGTGGDWGNGVGIDGSGNVYISGGMQSTVSFGATTLTSAGSNDIFLSKLNSSGTVQWATRVGGSGDDNGGWLQGLAVDSAGNSWVSGQIQGSVTVAGNTLTSAGGLDAFVGKVNTSGVWQWGAIGGSTSSDNDYGVAIDNAGNAYTTGIYRGAATFGSTSLSYAGGDDSFVAKLDASGSWQWARAAKGTGGDYAASIDVDSAGNPVVGGYFYSSSFVIGTTTLTYTAGSGADGWAAKWDTSGNFQWAKQLGGTDDDGFYGVAYDSDNNIRLTGWGGKTTALSFDGDTPIAIMQSCVSECWAYVEWKVSPSGGVPVATTTTSAAPTTTAAPTSSVSPATTLAPTTANTVAAVPQSKIASVSTTTTIKGVATSVAPIATTSTVAATSTTIVDENQPSSTEVKLGVLEATVGGEKVATTVTREQNRIVAKIGGISYTYSITDASGQTVPLDTSGNLHALPGQSIEMLASGGEPGSTGDVWMFSTPTKLGTFDISQDGTGSARFTIPSNVANGSHTLVVQSKNAQGQDAEVRLGFAIGKDAPKSSIVKMVLVVLALAMLLAVTIPVTVNRRRRNV